MQEPEPEPQTTRAPGTVGPEDFVQWHRSKPTLTNESGEQPKESRFPVRKRVNEKLYTWVGPIWRVATDVIVNTTSENFSERGGVSGGIFQAAGPELERECATMEGCRTGEAKLTGAYRLPCKAVVHTVGPKYNQKYRTAAENALHHCYFHCLEEMVEAGHRSIAFCCVHTDKKQYPRQAAAHIVIRTVRRFLEKYGNKIDALCFTFANAGEKSAYDTVLPLYFPRTKDEQYRAVSLLPKDVGNEWGETVVAERQVRVGESYSDTAGSSALGAPTGYEHDEWIEPEVDPTRPEGAAAAAEAEQYYQLLEQAKSKRLADIEAMNIVFRAGKDSNGLPVFVFVTKHIELDRLDLHDILLYTIRTLDADVSSPEGYTMVIVYSQVTNNNVPPFSWAREVYDQLPRKYKKHLKHLHLVHPSFMMKVATWFFQTFVSGKFWSKFVIHSDLETLYEQVSESELRLPEWVDAYNRTLFGRPPRPPPAPAKKTSKKGKGKQKLLSQHAADGL